MRDYFKNGKSAKRNLFVAGAVLSLLALFVAVYYQNQQTSLRSKAAEPQEQTKEGVIEMLHNDPDLESGKATMQTFLKTDDGKKVELSFEKGSPTGIAPGSRIRVKGSELNPQVFKVAPASVHESLTLSQKEQIIERLGGNDIQIIQAKNKVLGASTVVKLAVILVNFQNLQTQPFDKNQIIRDSFTDPTSLKAYFEENSYGKISVQGDVFGYYTMTDIPCSFYDNNKVLAKVRAEGINIDSYEKIVISWPYREGCHSGGASDLSRIAVISLNGGESKPGRWKAYAMHELAHSFGAYHSGNASCTDNAGNRVAMSNSCTGDDLGRNDPFDVMGRGSYHLNIIHKLEANFLSSSQVQTISTNGIYAIQPLEKPSTGIQGLKISTGSGKNYYLEYRQPFGVFDTFAPTNPVTTGVTIRRPSNIFQASSEIIDTTPGSVSNNPLGIPSFTDAPLAVGKAFYDPVSKLKIETMGVSASQATVKVTFNASADTTPTPAIATPSPTVSVPTPTIAIAPTSIPSPTLANKPTPTPTKKLVPTPIPKPSTSSDKTPPTVPSSLVGYPISHGPILSGINQRTTKE